MVSNNNTGQYHYHIQFFSDSINMEYKLLKIYIVYVWLPCKNWICCLWGPEDDSIQSKHVAHVSIVVNIAINCCVRLLHLVPILIPVSYSGNWGLRVLAPNSFVCSRFLMIVLSYWRKYWNIAFKYVTILFF